MLTSIQPLTCVCRCFPKLIINYFPLRAQWGSRKAGFITKVKNGILRRKSDVFLCNTVNSTLTLPDCKPTGLLQIEFFVDSVMAHILISNRLCAHVHVQMRRSKFYVHPRPRGFQCLSFVICMFSIFIVLPSVHASLWVGFKCCVSHRLLVKRKCQNDSAMDRPLSFFSNPNDGS